MVRVPLLVCSSAFSTHIQHSTSLNGEGLVWDKEIGAGASCAPVSFDGGLGCLYMCLVPCQVGQGDGPPVTGGSCSRERERACETNQD